MAASSLNTSLTTIQAVLFGGAVANDAAKRKPPSCSLTQAKETTETRESKKENVLARPPPSFPFAAASSSAVHTKKHKTAQTQQIHCAAKVAFTASSPPPPSPPLCTAAETIGGRGPRHKTLQQRAAAAWGAGQVSFSVDDTLLQDGAWLPETRVLSQQLFEHSPPEDPLETKALCRPNPGSPHSPGSHDSLTSATAVPRSPLSPRQVLAVPRPGRPGIRKANGWSSPPSPRVAPASGSSAAYVPSRRRPSVPAELQAAKPAKAAQSNAEDERYSASSTTSWQPLPPPRSQHSAPSSDKPPGLNMGVAMSPTRVQAAPQVPQRAAAPAYETTNKNIRVNDRAGSKTVQQEPHGHTIASVMSRSAPDRQAGAMLGAPASFVHLKHMIPMRGRGLGITVTSCDGAGHGLMVYMVCSTGSSSGRLLPGDIISSVGWLCGGTSEHTRS